jgi:dTDP-glucose 4,6-dehydratase
MNWHHSISDDLDVIVMERSLFEKYKNQRVTILGGSGFIGKWILSSLIHANETFQTNIDISVIATDASKLRNAYGDKINKFTFLDLDLSRLTEDFLLPESDFFIHAATSTNPFLHAKFGQTILTIAEKSSMAILQSARKYGNVPRVIHLSSGIVYPRSAKLDQAIPETRVPPDVPIEPTYKGAKIKIERLISDSAISGEICASNPRLFAFSGPGIPINAHFAVGNFMQDVLADRAIRITGNPSTRRSYMYPTDLVAWLLTILGDPRDVPINVGSDSSISIGELASVISNLGTGLPPEITNPSISADSYFPATDTASSIYGLQVKVTLEEGLKKWLKFLRLM